MVVDRLVVAQAPEVLRPPVPDLDALLGSSTATPRPSEVRIDSRKWLRGVSSAVRSRSSSLIGSSSSFVAGAPRSSSRALRWSTGAPRWSSPAPRPWTAAPRWSSRARRSSTAAPRRRARGRAGCPRARPWIVASGVTSWNGTLVPSAVFAEESSGWTQKLQVPWLAALRSECSPARRRRAGACAVRRRVAGPRSTGRLRERGARRTAARHRPGQVLDSARAGRLANESERCARRSPSGPGRARARRRG